MTFGRPILERSAVRGRRTLAGVGFAVAFHALFLGMIVFRLTAKPPPAVVDTAEPAGLSVSLVRGVAPQPSAQADEADPPASALSKVPVTDAPATPPPTPAALPAPRLAEDQAPQPLTPQKTADTPDLQHEPAPLHRQAAGVPSTGAASAKGGAPDCRLAPAIQQVLQGDPTVLTAIGSLPRQSRSVANAVMLWQGVWTPDRQMPVIQSALQAAIRKSAQACRDQPMRGPQFMTVTQGGDTTVLVVGSGDWTWAQLLP